MGHGVADRRPAASLTLAKESVMRVGTVVLVAASLAAGSVFVACGSTVSETAGNGTSGAGGHAATTTTGAGGGHATTTSSTSSTTASTTSSTATVTGTGGAGGAGGDVCSQACDKLKTQCGVDACAQIPGGTLPCPQYACEAKCLEASNCGELFACYQGGPSGALSGCLDACNSPIKCKSGGGGNGAGGGGSGQQCGQCVAQKCFQQAMACNQDPNCKPYANCVLGCAQSKDVITCTNACGAKYPSQSAAQGDLYACTCSKCQACSMLDVCAIGGSDAGADGG
jgi:hypothetical protein